ncbi:hypothetical protein NF27_IN00580 [Candidatus Jidaibacter acanthamoeba]|uniref:Phosphoesterase HXTX domain-containing protein n=1 Tax=Candidatus Jidaibacter acanthamoebae TaxID=86105 RepID=A0A0C1MQM7_9RICK|nr:RNA 2',3'-cyclic phosphodiesterase [Candidatus Jidaibacter acanthamoeba]KIE04317.1 hypothetical protein NF27_IN00580 [Candidatus Jidaibacter acanthamoeba]
MSVPIIGNAFIGIAIPEHITDLITDLYDNDLKNIKYVKPSNLHITLKFLGKSDEREIILIKEALNLMRFTHSDIILNKAVFWSPNIVVVEVELNPYLNIVKYELDKILFRHALIDIDKRPFKPHITVARTKAKFNKIELNNLLTTYKTINNKKFQSNQIHLYRSLRIESKQSDYIKLFTV